MYYSYKMNEKNEKPSKIIGIQFSILSPEEIRRGSVAEVVTRDTYINNKPVIGGLFDPRMGVLEPGFICPTDGHNYIKTPGYFGHIELARPVFYIQFLNSILKILRCVCLKCSKLLINKKKYQNLLNLSNKQRWDAVFKLCNKIKRCGEETEDGCGCKKPKKISKEGLATLYAEWENTDKIANQDGQIEDKKIMKLIPELVLKIFRRISNEDVHFMGFSPIWSRPDWMICQVMSVPPPAVRPSVKHDAQQRSEDDISHIIVNIIKANKTLQEKIESNAPSKVIDDWHTVLQYYVATMIDNKIPGVASVAQRSGRALKSIKERLVGKQGRVRGNLMGKRVDYSARSVIGPDPALSIRELGVPLKIAKNITVKVVVNKRNKNYLTKLVLNGPDQWPGANIWEKGNGDNISLRQIDRNSIDLQYGDIIHRHLQDGDPVLFNRQPTLHRMSMMCHIVKIMHVGNTFRMNVADTKPYNADFDGDEMNMHGPQDIEAASELRNLAIVTKQIISPANNKSIIGIFQDSLLSTYRLTRSNIKFSQRDAMNLLMGVQNINISNIQNKDTLTNFDVLSQIFPEMSCKFQNGGFSGKDNKKTTNNIIEIVNGKMLRGQIDKGILDSNSKGLIQRIFNDFGNERATQFIDELQFIVTEYMKKSSYSVGISDLIANEETNEKITTAINKKKQDVNNLIQQLHLGVFDNNTGRSNAEEFETQVNSLLNEAASAAGKIGRESLSKDNKFVIMVKAGSKGKTLNIAQMISCLGQQNVDGKRIPYGFDNRTLPHYTKFNDSPEARGFVESSFIQGLTPEEMFFHAVGGRIGLIDTAVKTSQTGYIQRRLIKGLEDIKVSYDMTARNNKNKIIQFKYGYDCIDSCKTENQVLPLTKMSIEEIYAHYQMPTFDKNDVYTTNFTKDCIKRIKIQDSKLKEQTKKILSYMLDSREDLIKHVFKYEDNIKIHIPVNFFRIITNVQNQLHIQKDSIVNITPHEVYELIDQTYESLEKMPLFAPTKLFKVAYYYYLSPKDLLLVNKFNKKAIILLLENIVLQYKKSLVHPGEMVGMISAQSIGEPTTQMTLNTFHFAGVASKSNVTRGVPRIEEILSLSANPKKPGVTIYLKDKDEEHVEKALELKYKLEHTCLRDITNKVSICFDPDKMTTLIDEDKDLMKEYNMFEKMIEKTGGCNIENKDEMSKWIIRLELDRESMLEQNINMDDIHFAIKNSYKSSIQCIYSDFNASNLVFRIRIVESLFKTKKTSLDQSDEIYMLKNMQENILNNIILKGVKNIKKINARTIKNTMKKNNGNWVPKDIWVLDTVGTNLLDILGRDDIDFSRTFSNDIQEIYKLLGIEAARQSVYNEFDEAISFDGTYINTHHLDLLCDRMCATKKMVSIFRHGINNDDIGPIAKASFEETPEMFIRAAKHGELDLMTGVSSNIMCGQEGYFGTSSFQLILDIDKMGELGDKSLDAEEDYTNDIYKHVDEKCAMENIKLNDTTKYIKKEDLGDIDTEYDPGF